MIIYENNGRWSVDIYGPSVFYDFKSTGLNYPINLKLTKITLMYV